METLPLDTAWPELERALKAHQNLVLVAEPGAGKTTRFPPRLLQSRLVPDDKKILVLEPRRLAARASAARIASEQKWNLGIEVGYQVRFENKTTSKTRLQFLTEGLLGRRLQTDPELRDVGVVILDEFHERSQHTDLALGLLFELQTLARPDLRIVVMSATLDAASVASYLNDAPIVNIPGRTFPVDIHHSTQPLDLEGGPNFLDRVAEMILLATDGVRPHAGDILVFLPGAREIRGVRERIALKAERAGFTTFELHGSLPLEEQDRAIRKLEGGRRKVVLATNIAETSLTIDGVGTVIDSGLARVSRTDALGFSRLALSRISLASATQRAGRAGRQGPGHCYRLWNKQDEASMPAFETPEILRTDLTDPLLTLLSQNVSDPQKFSWFDRPAASALSFAERTLVDLGFRDSRTGALTAEGREALKLPLTARLARLLMEAKRVNRPRLGARLTALLSERDIVTRASDLKFEAQIESDLLVRLHLLDNEGRGRSPVDRAAVANVRRIAEALESAVERIQIPPGSLKAVSEDELALKLCLLAFPDRVCRRRDSGQAAARMVGAKGVKLAPFSTVETEDFFVAIEASGARGDAQVTVASYVKKEWIEDLFPNSISRESWTEFNEETESVQKLIALSFRDLPLEKPRVARPENEEAFPVLQEAALARWRERFATAPDLSELFSRLHFLKETLSPDEFPEFNTDEIRDRLLEEACYGETRLGDVLRKPLAEIYIRYLPQKVSLLLGSQAPDRIQVPTGSQIQVHYPEGRGPYLEVRLQELFGLHQTPRIAQGRIPVTLHLLGPNYRPVQVTSDLESFWKNGYPEVRKELRARYPKHSWPDDPLTARPEAKGRRSR